MIYEEFKRVLQSSETVEVEFKTARGGLPGSLWETYSSFGNTQGGQIILGVKEKGHRFVLDGLTKEVVLDYKKRLFDCLNNRQKVSVNILKGFSFEEDIDEESFREYRQFVLDQHPADITQLLKELCEEGFLRASGIGKNSICERKASRNCK